MLIKDAKFICSNIKIAQCPLPLLPEYAFIGRSNVGKSSLINMLTGKKNLAKTSSAPGKTQTINHFLINGSWYLVDLPGYGFAKAPKSVKYKWDQLIVDYLLKRQNLMNVFLLIDSRLEPQQIDLEFIDWIGKNKIPFSILFTKTDKLSNSKMQKNVELYQEKLLETWEELPNMILTSSLKRTGKEALLKFIEENNLVFSEWSKRNKTL